MSLIRTGVESVNGVPTIWTSGPVDDSGVARTTLKRAWRVRSRKRILLGFEGMD